jgi:rubrerythrin
MNILYRLYASTPIFPILLSGFMVVSLPASGQTNLLHVGDSMDDVVAIMGQPKGRMNVGNSVVWDYERGTVEFQGGKVKVLDPRIVREQDEMTRLAAIKQAGITLDNMVAACGSESTAQALCEAYSEKADEECFKSVAALFRAAAKSKFIRADHHGDMIRKIGAVNPNASAAMFYHFDVKTTKESLGAAIKDATTAKDTTYPAFAKQAEIDKNDGEAKVFTNAIACETELLRLYNKALTELESWKPAAKEFLVCQVCGYATISEPQLQKCPVCDAPREKLDIVK